MISWKNLIDCIEKLEELPNGGGSEIEFFYQGDEFCVVSYRGKCDIGKCPKTSFSDGTLTRSKEQIYNYKSLEELGKSKDVGFSVEEQWESLEDVCIKPDFNEFSFEEIYDAYEKANKRKIDQ